MDDQVSKHNFNEQAVFPAIVLYEDGDVTIDDDLNAYITCRTLNVRAGQRGRFAKSRVFDSNGVIWPVEGARILHGVGPFWGYSLLGYRKVKVEPILVGEPTLADFLAMKAEVYERLRSRKSVITIQLKKRCAFIDHQRVLLAADAVESASTPSELIGCFLAIELTGCF